MDPVDVFNFIDSISEEQALDSDIEGDSDADNNFPMGPTPSTPKSRKRDHEEISDFIEDDELFTNTKPLQSEDGEFKWTKNPYLPHIFEAVTSTETPGAKHPLSESPLDIIRRIFGYGTVRTNRKTFPRKELVSDKRLDTGKSDSVGTSNIIVSKWKDRGKKCLVVASTMHSTAEMSTVNRMTKEGVRVQIACPKSVDDYNRNMGGVDRRDQLQPCYSIAWKSRRWWLKLLYYLVDANIVDSYNLYKSSVENQRHRTVFCFETPPYSSYRVNFSGIICKVSKLIM
ncbi:hypothetical protein ILUMI_17621 [Ignelater luminosus]|uniref:PiggyBac transposable element-derived protein domain-containing protein n=1 Tax=Ignelater luminosus TaxID=2038154 RepID=A0A8K0G4W5_IGNLU|nr:hypothetical protein ILUMI_17621 [Ignelater luminosus]